MTTADGDVPATIRVLVIPADESEPVRLEEVPASWRALYRLVGGSVSLVDLPDTGAGMFVDGNGKLPPVLPRNRRAEILTGLTGDWLAGDVVIYGGSANDPHPSDAPEALLAWVEPDPREENAWRAANRQAGRVFAIVMLEYGDDDETPEEVNARQARRRALCQQVDTSLERTMRRYHVSRSFVMQAAGFRDGPDTTVTEVFFPTKPAMSPREPSTPNHQNTTT